MKINNHSDFFKHMKFYLRFFRRKPTIDGDSRSFLRTSSHPSKLPSAQTQPSLSQLALPDVGPTAGPPRASPRASGGSVGLSSLEANRGSVSSEAVSLMGPQGRRQSKSERQGGCFLCFFFGMDVWRIIGVERGSCEWLMVERENRVLLGRDFVKRPQKM